MTEGAVYGVVANFSEGRRADVIDAICAALAVPGARLVYRQSDPDHHRLDTTVLGDRDAVVRSAMAGARVAVALIDMDRHTGGHPRMGAVDVIPFMPVRGVTMEANDRARARVRPRARDGARPARLPVRPRGAAARAGVARRRPSRRVRGDQGRRRRRGSGCPTSARTPSARPARRPWGRASRSSRSTCTSPVRTRRRRRRSPAPCAHRAAACPRSARSGSSVPERGCVTVSMNLVDVEVTGIRAAFDAVANEASVARPRGPGFGDRGARAGGGPCRWRHRARSSDSIRTGPADPGTTDRGGGMSETWGSGPSGSDDASRADDAAGQGRGPGDRAAERRRRGRLVDLG